MTRFFLGVIFLFALSQLTAQDQILAFRKNSKIIHTYSTGSYIAFMDHGRQWQYGIITRIRKDSFYIRPYVLLVSLKIDTMSFDLSAYSLADAYAMPKPGVEIGDVKDSKNSQILTDAGHVHFYWIKGGWLFRVLGIGYPGLNIFNSVVTKNQPISWAGLGIAAGLFAFGGLLKLSYSPILKLGKKYSMKVY
jgi:hypothetical protein